MEVCKIVIGIQTPHCIEASLRARLAKARILAAMVRLRGDKGA